MPVKPLVAVRRGAGDDRRWFVVLIRGDRAVDVVQAHRWRWTGERAARRLARRLSSRTVGG